MRVFRNSYKLNKNFAFSINWLPNNLLHPEILFVILLTISVQWISPILFLLVDIELINRKFLSTDGADLCRNDCLLAIFGLPSPTTWMQISALLVALHAWIFQYSELIVNAVTTYLLYLFHHSFISLIHSSESQKNHRRPPHVFLLPLQHFPMFSLLNPVI